MSIRGESVTTEQHHRKFRLKVAPIALALVIVPTHSTAQQVTVVVNVRDESQAAVPGAYVRLYPSADGKPATMRDGRFSFSAKPGDYDLFVEVMGFREVAKRVKVLGGEPTVFDLNLQVGSCSACLTVGPWDPAVVLSLSGNGFRDVALGVADLKPPKEAQCRYQRR